ncbi:hypothetical protein NE237_026978 [Protea cynaroides]|uniref:Uncharacterized protein n=1 Tax=Protea cynaroides TaxID=273540 RepID=A0A9Q0JSJ6_9MAGN|nr:hypothetical protein NE237_026978 [Protea cynaroides]
MEAGRANSVLDLITMEKSTPDFERGISLTPVTISETDVTLGDGLVAKEAEVPIRAKKKSPVGSHPDLSEDPTLLPRRAGRGKSTLDVSPSALPDGLLHIPVDSGSTGDPIPTTSGSGWIRMKRRRTETLAADSNPLESLHSPIQSKALCHPSSSQLPPFLLYPACASVPHPPPSAVELSNLILAKHASNSAPSPSNSLAIVDSIGSSLCGSDVDIVNPWDGNPTAVFSPEHSPSYLEPLPLASPHPLISSDDDARSISDDYSSSNETRLEAEWFASSISYYLISHGIFGSVSLVEGACSLCFEPGLRPCSVPLVSFLF